MFHPFIATRCTKPSVHRWPFMLCDIIQIVHSCSADHLQYTCQPSWFEGFATAANRAFCKEFLPRGCSLAISETSGACWSTIKSTPMGPTAEWKIQTPNALRILITVLRLLPKRPMPTPNARQCTSCMRGGFSNAAVHKGAAHG